MIIENDDGIHTLPEVIENDITRQKDLEELGIRVIWFTNNDILKKLETTIRNIENSIK